MPGKRYYLKHFREEPLSDFDHFKVFKVVQGGDGTLDGVARAPVDVDAPDGPVRLNLAEHFKGLLVGRGQQRFKALTSSSCSGSAILDAVQIVQVVFQHTVFL